MGDANSLVSLRKSLPSSDTIYGISFYGMSTLDNYVVLDKLGEGTFGTVTKCLLKDKTAISTRQRRNLLSPSSAPVAHSNSSVRPGSSGSSFSSSVLLQSTHSSNASNNNKKGKLVALKKIIIHDLKEGFPITALREVTILKQLNHKNILPLLDIVHEKNKKLTTSSLEHSDFFLVSPYMKSDLSGLLNNPDIKFDESIIKCFLKQLLEGLNYLHHRKFYHRDIKTANLLVDHNGILKIADFGLARKYYGHTPRPSGGPSEVKALYTGLVVTRWYRAPELLLGDRKYTTAIDMWGVGCIFAELFEAKPILMGRTDLDQINQIFQLIGEPTEESYPGFQSLPNPLNATITHYKPSLRNRFERFFETGFSRDYGMDLLGKLLHLNPNTRFNAEQALNHKYFITAPFPKRPRDLPKFVESHEMDNKRFKQEKERRERLQEQQDASFVNEMDHRYSSVYMTGSRNISNSNISGMNGGSGSFNRHLGENSRVKLNTSLSSSYRDRENFSEKDGGIRSRHLQPIKKEISLPPRPTNGPSWSRNPMGLQDSNDTKRQKTKPSEPTKPTAGLAPWEVKADPEKSATAAAPWENNSKGSFLSILPNKNKFLFGGTPKKSKDPLVKSMDSHTPGQVTAISFFAEEESSEPKAKKNEEATAPKAFGAKASGAKTLGAKTPGVKADPSTKLLPPHRSKVSPTKVEKLNSTVAPSKAESPSITAGSIAKQQDKPKPSTKAHESTGKPPNLSSVLFARSRPSAKLSAQNKAGARRDLLSLINKLKSKGSDLISISKTRPEQHDKPKNRSEHLNEKPSSSSLRSKQLDMVNKTLSGEGKSSVRLSLASLSPALKPAKDEKKSEQTCTGSTEANHLRTPKSRNGSRSTLQVDFSPLSDIEFNDQEEYVLSKKSSFEPL